MTEPLMTEPPSPDALPFRSPRPKASASARQPNGTAVVTYR
jgi:hypothetical protein